MDLLIPNMRAFPISSGTPHTLFFRDGGTSPGITAAANRIRSPSSSSSSHALVGAAAAAAASPKLFSYKFGYSNEDSNSFGGDADGDEEIEVEKLENNGVEEVEIEKLGNNSRRIRSKIVIDANLHTVWSILTDYEGLADFIPGLAVSQLVEKGEKFARLFQIGQQDLAFGLKFNAKGIVDCYEKDLESLPFGEKRDIEFKMIEGDFQIFEGKWSIEQRNTNTWEGKDSSVGQEFYTTLTYVVDVEPKRWLPVYLVEGRLSREIKMNLTCIREEAKKRTHNPLSAQ